VFDTSAFTEGLLLGAGLFTSVGPKDAFVVKRSLSGRHLLLIAAICAGSDALLIALGSQGLAATLSNSPRLLSFALWGGVGYLACHGLLALRSALQRGRNAAIDAAAQQQPMLRTLLATAAMSLLNPYAWVDTVLVIGSIIVSRPSDARTPFALGAVAASFLWFLLLTYGARACRALFARPLAWRALDGVVAMMMLGVAVHLALGQL
jgi:L-lysine exporter family protein LysE/ArgO